MLCFLAYSCCVFSLCCVLHGVFLHILVLVVFCCVLSGVVWCFLTRSHSCCGVLSCIAWCFLAHVPVLVVLCGVF